MKIATNKVNRGSERLATILGARPLEIIMSYLLHLSNPAACICPVYARWYARICIAKLRVHPSMTYMAYLRLFAPELLALPAFSTRAVPRGETRGISRVIRASRLASSETGPRSLRAGTMDLTIECLSIHLDESTSGKSARFSLVTRQFSRLEMPKR